MNIGVLIFSNPRNESSSSAERLEEAATQRGHQLTRIYEPALSFIDGKILHNNEPLPKLDVIISRPNFIEEPSLRTYAVQKLVNAGYRVINSAPSFTWAKNKLTQHVEFEKHNLPCPRWGIARKPNQALEIASQICFPVIIKTAFGTFGKGVFLARDAETFQPIAEYLAIRDGNPLIIEEFIEEAEGRDLRAFVLNGDVIGAMERHSPQGDVRANTSSGGTGYRVDLTPKEKELAIKTTNIFNLEIAGVDIIRSKRGPLLLEINSNPGFKELERVTEKDIAGAIIDYSLSQI
ncbi:MAG: RimK family alpha-L-glutamate ligase [bacterium]|jgi:ribosomal protein S6--L-glutamate ligase|nr:RimK family alpha-L-glutamate ligase [bacterium]